MVKALTTVRALKIECLSKWTITQKCLNLKYKLTINSYPLIENIVPCS